MSDESSPDAMRGADTTEAERRLPGLTLRAAREARGLSLSEVAQVTRFSVRQIEALENDDYAALPGNTAVRGFVRAYAKLLKLDAEPLLAGLGLSAPMAMADVRPPTQVGEVEQPTWRQRIKLGRIVTAFLWGVLLLAAAWYIGRPDLETMFRPMADDASPTMTKSATHSVADAAPPPAAAESSIPAASALPAAIDEAATTAPMAPAEPRAPDVLHLAFDELSWIEITDASEQVIFRGEYPAGTRQDVTGRPPFQVWIGKASGVRLSFGDRAIDLQPYTRADVARLTVE